MENKTLEGLIRLACGYKTMEKIETCDSRGYKRWTRKIKTHLPSMRAQEMLRFMGYYRNNLNLLPDGKPRLEAPCGREV
jgi:hypothetical protein